MGHCQKCHSWWFGLALSAAGHVYDLPSDVVSWREGGETHLKHRGHVHICGGEVILLKVNPPGLAAFNRAFLERG